MKEKKNQIRGVITRKLNFIITDEVNALLKDYARFRESLGKDGQNGASINLAIGEEVIWEDKIKNKKKLIKDKKIIVPKKQKDVINLGSKFTLFSNGTEKELVLDGAGYKGNGLHIISVESRLGAQLLGKKKGDVVEKMTVKEIFYPW